MTQRTDYCPKCNAYRTEECFDTCACGQDMCAPCLLSSALHLKHLWDRERGQHAITLALLESAREELLKGKSRSKACSYCGGPAEGNHSIHRDGFGVGPEVDLCDMCGGSETPTCEEIWWRISGKRKGTK